MNCLVVLETAKLDQDIAAPIREALELMEFPPEASYPTSSRELRQAVYSAFGGRDFYTGTKINIEDMVIDHILPVAKGGPDNIYNYVSTTAYHNTRKTDKIEVHSLLASLSLVRSVYAPKVLANLEKKRNKKNQEGRKNQASKAEESHSNHVKNRGIKSWEFWEWQKPLAKELLLWEWLYEEIKHNPNVSKVILSQKEVALNFGEKWEEILNQIYINNLVDMNYYSAKGKKANPGWISVYFLH